MTSNGTRYDFHLGNDSSYDTSLTLTDADGNRVILKDEDVPPKFITGVIEERPKKYNVLR